ncbi:MAG: hypothetical protein AB1546_14345 [bacterium]
MKAKTVWVTMLMLFWGLMVAVFPMLSVATAVEEMITEAEDAFGNILQTSIAKIDSVEFTAPAANAPCKVTAKITIIDEDEEASLTAVMLTYYINGDPKGTTIPMKEASGVYTAEIPGKPSGTKVDFIIRAEDSNKNVTSQAVATANFAVAAIPDVDNPADIVGDDMDILGFSAGYDDTYLYVNYDVQGKISGGTIEPPDINAYGIKVSNPDIDQGEGVTAGKLWVSVPLAKEKVVNEKIMSLLSEIISAKEFLEEIGMDKVERMKQSGMLVMDLSKLIGGKMTEWLLYNAEPDGVVDGGKFTGKINRAVFGENKTGYYRILVVTVKNQSLDLFMPIPLNCSNYLTLYTDSQSYTVK